MDITNHLASCSSHHYQVPAHLVGLLDLAHGIHQRLRLKEQCLQVQLGGMEAVMTSNHNQCKGSQIIFLRQLCAIQASVDFSK